MLPKYGVLVGTYQSHTTEQGQWFHVDLMMLAGRTQFQAAVDVNEQNGAFQYSVFNNLNAQLFANVSTLQEGWHELAPSSTSGAIDYSRSAIFKEPSGCLSIFWGLFGKSNQSWINVTGNEAGEALIAMVTNSAKLFVFGAPYTTGNGVHDVHCNQGDPPGPHQADDGIWQDGCVFAIQSDGSVSAYLGKFATQSLDTTSSGLPK